MKATRLAAAFVGCASVVTPVLAQVVVTATRPPAALLEPPSANSIPTPPTDGVIAGATAPVSSIWESRIVEPSEVIPVIAAGPQRGQDATVDMLYEPLVAGAAPAALQVTRPVAAAPPPPPISPARPALAVAGPVIPGAAQPVSAELVASIPARFDWIGFYAGVSVARNWSVFDAVQTRSPALVNPELAGFKASDAGGSFGLLAGYDWQAAPRVVAGLFASYDFLGGQGIASTGPTQAWTADLGDVWTIAGRAGWLATPRVLFYGLVGLSGSTVTLGYSDSSQPLSYLAEDRVLGLTAGLGLEAILAPRVSARVEYRYTDFGAAEVVGASPGASGATSAEISLQSVRGAVVYRFGE